MEICIAMVRLKSGTEAIVRGSPEGVSEAVSIGVDNSGGGEILCLVQDNAEDKHEEDSLWLRFLHEANATAIGSMPHEKYLIWRRKATGLWDLGYQSLGNVCIFMRDSEDMILRGPDPDIPQPKKVIN